MNTPTPLTRSSQEADQRTVFLVRLAQFAVVTSGGAAVLMGVLGYSALTISGLVGLALVAGVSGALLNRIKTPTMAYGATLIGYILTLCLVSLGIGGLLAGVTPWLAMTPLLTLAYGSREMGRASLALSIAAIVVLGLYTLNLHWDNPDMPKPRILLQVLSVSAAALFTYRVSTDQEVLRTLALNEMRDAYDALGQELEQHRATQQALENTTDKLISTARAAGMAEVATGVVHNLGNALNSVNVAVAMVTRELDQDMATKLERLAERSAEADPERLAQYLHALAETQRTRTATMRTEIEAVRKRLDHVATIVQAQQVHARSKGLVADVNLSDAIREALTLVSGLDSQGVHVHLAGVEQAHHVVTERHKLLQILTNLIGNARDAIGGTGTIHISVRPTTSGAIVTVTDDGLGIPPEHIKRVFEHGFTTKDDGNGFGLHASALAAAEVGGRLSCHSAGLGHGATFSLELPQNSDQGLTPDSVGRALLS